MEREQGGVYYVFEWSIKNFSCWNREIHGSGIQSPKSYNFGSLYLELYPRGISGNDEHLVTHINGAGWQLILLGELTYIGPDGSLLYTQQIDSKGHSSVIKLPPGPKFQEVVARINKNEALHENRLTVRYLLKYFEKYTEYMHTEICVFEVSFKMSLETLKNLDSEAKTRFWICYPQGDRRDRIGLSAFKDKTDPSKIMMELKPLHVTKNVLVLARMYVLDIEDELVKTEEDEHVFLDLHGLFSLQNKGWTFSITLAKEEMKDLKESQTSMILSLKIIPSINNRYSLSLLQFSDRKVDIYLSNSFMPHSTKKSLKSVTNQKNASVTLLTKELMCLYQDQDFSDFQLKCHNVSFPVHRNVLSARSPVLKTMLSTDMKEAASGEVDVGDLDPSTLAQFLTYLYSGALEEDLQCDRALKLYYAADKYQVPSLKKECAQFLCDEVSIGNVCNLLSFADKYSDDELTAVAYSFVVNNFNHVLQSEEWASFAESDPKLALKTVTQLAQKNYVGKMQ